MTQIPDPATDSSQPRYSREAEPHIRQLDKFAAAPRKFLWFAVGCGLFSAIFLWQALLNANSPAGATWATLSGTMATLAGSMVVMMDVSEQRFQMTRQTMLARLTALVQTQQARAHTFKTSLDTLCPGAVIPFSSQCYVRAAAPEEHPPQVETTQEYLNLSKFFKTHLKGESLKSAESLAKEWLQLEDRLNRDARAIEEVANYNPLDGTPKNWPFRLSCIGRCRAVGGAFLTGGLYCKAAGWLVPAFPYSSVFALALVILACVGFGISFILSGREGL